MELIPNIASTESNVRPKHLQEPTEINGFKWIAKFIRLMKLDSLFHKWKQKTKKSDEYIEVQWIFIAKNPKPQRQQKHARRVCCWIIYLFIILLLLFLLVHYSCYTSLIVYWLTSQIYINFGLEQAV